MNLKNTIKLSCNNSLCLQYVEPNFSFIYLKASQSFCSVGVSQYSQETPALEPPFL